MPRAWRRRSTASPAGASSSTWLTGGDPVELKGDGVFLEHDARYEATDEFLTVWRRLLAGEEVTFRGKHLAIEGGKLLYPPIQAPHPPLYFGGPRRPATRSPQSMSTCT